MYLCVNGYEIIFSHFIDTLYTSLFVYLNMCSIVIYIFIYFYLVYIYLFIKINCHTICFRDFILLLSSLTMIFLQFKNLVNINNTGITSLAVK